MMKISVITPTLNSQETISRNIKSIQFQSYSGFEHIIVDNLSTDLTIPIVKRMYEDKELHKDKVKMISEKDDGIADAFNKGIINSDGDILTFLNSDDEYYHQQVFEKVIEAFEEEKTLIVHGDIYFHDPIYGSVVKFPKLKITDGMGFYHPTMFFRKEVFLKLGLYNTSYTLAMDYEFLCRVFKQSPDIFARMKYIVGPPLVKMYYGGASWNNALCAIEETRKALIQHGLWNWRAKLIFINNIIKTKLKELFIILGLNTFLALMRKFKWHQLHPYRNVR